MPGGSVDGCMGTSSSGFQNLGSFAVAGQVLEWYNR
jgi:hypothetical protein